MGAVTETWERPGAWQRAMDAYERASKAIEAIVSGKGAQLLREPAAGTRVAPASAGGSNAPMAPRGVETDQEQLPGKGIRSSEVEASVTTTEEDSGPRAAVFGRHVFRWERSEKHGELVAELQGRKGEGCLVRAVSLVRKPLEPHEWLFPGKRPEPGTHSVLLEFGDGYQVVTSMWAIRKVA